MSRQRLGKGRGSIRQGLKSGAAPLAPIEVAARTLVRLMVHPLAPALVLATAILLGVPDPAHACSVCPLGSGRTGKAYLIAGILVSSTQLLAVGSLVWWWRRRVRQADRRDLT